MEIFGFFLFFPFLLVGLVLWVWALVEVLRSGEEDTAKILWVLILIFIPVIGWIIWLFIGPRAGKKKS